MKIDLAVVLLSGLAVFALCSSAPQGSGEASPLELRVAALEKELALAKSGSEALTKELAHSRGFDLDVARYLDTQGKAAASLVSALEQAEAAGFTVGINPESRQILLRGWREQLAGLQQSIPTVREPEKPSAPAKTKPSAGSR